MQISFPPIAHSSFFLGDRGAILIEMYQFVLVGWFGNMIAASFMYKGVP